MSSGNAASGNWSIMTQGISTAGLEQLYNDIQMKMVQEAKENLREFSNLKEVITAGWIGGDRDVFLDNFNKLVEEICTQLDEYDVQLKSKFDDITASWAEFQEANVSAE